MEFEKNNFNEYLKCLIEPLITKLDIERSDVLKSELNEIVECGYAKKIILAYEIAKYLKAKNEYYILSCDLINSYLAYELGIHNVDCYNLGTKLKINNNELRFYVDQRIQLETLKYIDSIFENNIYHVLTLLSNGNEQENLVRRIYSSDEYIKSKSTQLESKTYNKKINFLKEKIINSNLAKLIKINLFGLSDITIINKTLEIVRCRYNIQINEIINEQKNISKNMIDVFFIGSINKRQIDLCKIKEYILPVTWCKRNLTNIKIMLFYKTLQTRFSLELYKTYLNELITELKHSNLLEQNTNKYNFKFNLINDNNDLEYRKEGILRILNYIELEGYKIEKPDLNISEITEFIIDYGNNSLIAPLYLIENITLNECKKIVSERKNNLYCSLDDLVNRVSLHEKSINDMKKYYIFKEN